MSAQGARTGAGVCGHAFHAARERGIAAAGRRAFEIQRAAVRDGVPAAVYTHVPWDEMDSGSQEYWIGLVHEAEGAFWEAWTAD